MKLKCVDVHPGYWRYFTKGRIYYDLNGEVNGWKLDDESLNIHLDPEYNSSPVIARFEEPDEWDDREYEQKCNKAIQW